MEDLPHGQQSGRAASAFPPTASSEPLGCWPQWPEGLLMGSWGLCSSHRCFPLDFEEVNEQMFRMASAAPFLLSHEAVHAEKPPVALAAPLPLSRQSRQLSGGYLLHM